MVPADMSSFRLRLLTFTFSLQSSSSAVACSSSENHGINLQFLESLSFDSDSCDSVDEVEVFKNSSSRSVIFSDDSVEVTSMVSSSVASVDELEDSRISSDDSVEFFGELSDAFIGLCLESILRNITLHDRQTNSAAFDGVAQHFL